MNLTFVQTRRVFIGSFLSVCFLCSIPLAGHTQEFSSARIWNEMVLHAIRNDFARPTVHARNLYHTSMAMYDAFAVYDDINETVFLGKQTGSYFCEFDGIEIPLDVEAARREAISYAVYRLVQHRFQNSPGKDEIDHNINLIFAAFGYDPSYTSLDYQSGSPAALGNYIAASLIEYGLADGSNEGDDYANTYYEPVNPDLNPFQSWFDPELGIGNPRMNDPNRWQKLQIDGFVGQSGVRVEEVPPFLSPEWGLVDPFALSESDLIVKNRDGNDYWLYLDPGSPAMIGEDHPTGADNDYIWGFSMTAHWKSHTIPDTTYLIDISPASLGNSTVLPTSSEGFRNYYNFIDGGDYSVGHEVNPSTGNPYDTQMVPRSDYARVLAEFWADGPASETPPGHWFTILNYVSDQEALVKKYRGQGPILSDLEWDVKSYLALGGAMHDSAISAWSAKGFYDYPRPVSSIRYMVDKGQSTDPNGLNYDPQGIMLIPGSIEQILPGDRLLFPDMSNLGSIKFLQNVFNGTGFYTNGRFWLPYQDVSFVSPPFAGYVSGHSTFSRAAAEVLGVITGDLFFPGGMGEFHFEKGNFLEFGPEGPSRDMTLQWATYVDAANQSALSRIWGGIHPPIDDIPGRKMGVEVAMKTISKVDALFGDPVSSVSQVSLDRVVLYPNPVSSAGGITIDTDVVTGGGSQLHIFDQNGSLVYETVLSGASNYLDIQAMVIPSGVYSVQLRDEDRLSIAQLIVLR